MPGVGRGRDLMGLSFQLAISMGLAWWTQRPWSWRRRSGQRCPRSMCASPSRTRGPGEAPRLGPGAAQGAWDGIPTHTRVRGRGLAPPWRLRHCGSCAGGRGAPAPVCGSCLRMKLRESLLFFLFFFFFFTALLQYNRQSVAQKHGRLHACARGPHGPCRGPASPAPHGRPSARGRLRPPFPRSLLHRGRIALQVVIRDVQQG